MKSQANIYAGYIAITLILIAGVLSGSDTLKAQHVIMKVNGLEEPYYPSPRTYMTEAEIHDRIFELAPEFDEMANSRSLGDAIEEALAKLQRMRAFIPDGNGPFESNIDAYADAYIGEYHGASISNQSSSSTGQRNGSHQRGLSNRSDEPEGPGRDDVLGTGSQGSHDENSENIIGKTPGGPQGRSFYMDGSAGGYDQRGVSIRGEGPEVPGGPGYRTDPGEYVGGYNQRGVSIRGEGPDNPCGPGHDRSFSDGSNINSVDERMATIGGGIGAGIGSNNTRFEGNRASHDSSAYELLSNDVPLFDPEISVAALDDEGMPIDRIRNMGLIDSAYWLWYESQDQYSEKVIFIAFPVYRNAPYSGFKQVFSPKGKTNILSPFGIPFWANDDTSGPWILLVVNDRGNVAAAPLIVH